MNKAEVLFQLTAITREITCMSPSVFEEWFARGVMKFDHFCWDEDAKIRTEIHVRKIKMEPAPNDRPN